MIRLKALSALVTRTRILVVVTAPNDLVVAADGTVWFTDPPHFPPPDEPVGRVHTMVPSGTTCIAATGFKYCNGIALDPDGTPVIIEARGLLRLQPDGTRAWIVETLTGGAGDGFCVDVDGRYYIANTAAHGVRVVDLQQCVSRECRHQRRSQGTRVGRRGGMERRHAQ